MRSAGTRRPLHDDERKRDCPRSGERGPGRRIFHEEQCRVKEGHRHDATLAGQGPSRECLGRPRREQAASGSSHAACLVRGHVLPCLVAGCGLPVLRNSPVGAGFRLWRMGMEAVHEDHGESQHKGSRERQEASCRATAAPLCLSMPHVPRLLLHRFGMLACSDADGGESLTCIKRQKATRRRGYRCCQQPDSPPKYRRLLDFGKV